MSKKTQLVTLIGSTSIAALISAGSGLAQVIVDPGDTLIVGSGETINDEVILFDGSTLQVENGGIVVAPGSTITEGAAGSSVNVVNNGQITATAFRAILLTSSALQVDNSGFITGQVSGIQTDTLISLRNDASGVILGLGSAGVVVDDETETVTNDGVIRGGNFGFAGVGAIGSIHNSGLILGVDATGVQGFAEIGEIYNSGEVAGGIFAISSDSDVGSINNQGIVSGGLDGIAIAGNVGTLENDGLIEGLSRDGVSVGGQIGQFHNTGQILADTDAVTVDGEISTFNNSGTISGGVNGIFANNSIVSFTNSGKISGGTGEGLLSGDVNSFHNTGVIASDNSSGALIGSGSIGSIYNAGRIEGADHGLRTNGNIGDFQNHGTITGRNDAGFENNIVVSSFLNTGTISSDEQIGVVLNDAETFINSGTIIGDSIAFEINSSSGTDIFLRQGSNIQGLIAIEDIAGTSTLSTDPGMNLDLTFSIDVPVVRDTSGSPYVVSGDTIVVVDPSGFNGTDLFANDLTRSVLDVVSSTGARIPLTTQEPGTERNVWISGFGGQNQVSGTGVLQDSYGGLVGGVDLPSASGSVFGLFGGFGTGDISADNSGNTLDTDAVFAGGYYHRDFGSKFLRASVVGGQLSSSGSRDVFNNLATGGVETASSDYDGYFVSPSIELGARFDNLLANKPLLASLQLSYLHLSEDGYTETGVANPVAVDDSQSDYLNARAQITLPHEVSLGAGPNALLEFTAGIDGQFAMGDTSRKASVLGSDIELDPIYDDQLVRGFLGGSFRKQTRDGRGLFSIGADGFFGGSDDREIRGILSFQYVF
ncbi:autotransporter domain-containing protein [uncultured Ruegeria sp.]|uniref:autotransporter domain-containing protein n=1 Tax=uncultured Ruegeria sp. TaxID=259304 RepID=UPI0026376CF8|nr:autotransporter domain-containing protein [uncultured Ruegeria sp.]